MKQPLLVLDCHYLCYRAFHAQGELSFKGQMTGVVFGFLKSIRALKDEFQTDRVVFCFESNRLHRRDIYPDYKLGRHKKQNEEERMARQSFQMQVHLLERDYLPRIGFQNIFNFLGYEADDIMAAIASKIRGEIILVTADMDMLQCLRENVIIYSPQKRKIFTDSWFYNTYQMLPKQWAVVKAIAGCSSDNVAGIPGVGEKSALRYVQGDLKSGIYFDRIMAGKEIVRRNRQLVELPYGGCPVPEILEDKISKRGWLDVCGRLGMKSIAGSVPVATRALNHYARKTGFKI